MIQARAQHRWSRLRLGWLAGGGVLAGAAIVLLRLHDPNAAGSVFPPCIFHALTDFWCAGCGITRALHALVHGDVGMAFGFNPLAMLLLPFALLAFAWGGGLRPAWAAPVIDLLAKPMPWIVLIPAFWIARNLPWPPFSWLAPG